MLARRAGSTAARADMARERTDGMACVWCESGEDAAVLSTSRDVHDTFATRGSVGTCNSAPTMAIVSRRTTAVLVRLLALFLVGTVAVLALVCNYFRLEKRAYILPTELGTWDEIRADARPVVLDRVSEPSLDEVPPEQIPRIIHQTWKVETLPPHWAEVRQACKEMMPDFEFKLWTDESSREFIASEYPWFLETFDSYPYNIQRADAIRYFVLHKYGGVYMDLDIGCQRRFTPLLRFEVVLPETIPVGVSNDLIFSVPGHPFMDTLIHSLETFKHNFFLPYATVMFSTGPMFVSTVYRLLFNSKEGMTSQPSSSALPQRGFHGIRILPKSLYGKNAPPEIVPDSFFAHMYGSSWHEADANFLIFLRKYGRLLIALGVAVVVYNLRKHLARPVFIISSFLAKGIMALFRCGHMTADVSGGCVPESIDMCSADETKILLPAASDTHTPTAGLQHANLEEGKSASPYEYLPRESTEVPYSPLDAPVANVFASDLPAEKPSMLKPVPQYSFTPPSHSHQSSEHDVRIASQDAKLGTFVSKRTDRPASPLPAFYVDSSSEYAMDGLENDPEASGLGTDSPTRQQRRMSLARIREVTWRTLSPSSLLTLVPPPLRRTRVGRHSENEQQDGVQLTRTRSNQSDDCRSEWNHLISRSSSLTMSPPLPPRISPVPMPEPTASILASDSVTSQQKLQRRATGPPRVTTPAVMMPTKSGSGTDASGSL